MAASFVFTDVCRYTESWNVFPCQAASPAGAASGYSWLKNAAFARISSNLTNCFRVSYTIRSMSWGRWKS